MLLLGILLMALVGFQAVGVFVSWARAGKPRRLDDHYYADGLVLAIASVINLGWLVIMALAAVTILNLAR